MNLINQDVDMMQIKKITNEINELRTAEQTNLTNNMFQKEDNSFYLKREKLNSLEQYDFHTANEIQKMLEIHWQKNGINWPDELKRVITIALLKNKERPIENKKISEYIYEF